jgi:PrgI family protein
MPEFPTRIPGTEPPGMAGARPRAAPGGLRHPYPPGAMTDLASSGAAPAAEIRHNVAGQAVRIPADVDRPDRVFAGLTARQALVLSLTGIVLYAIWTPTQGLVALPVFLVLAIPLSTTAAILVLGQRDGISLDRLVLAALRQRLGPRYQVTAPEGIPPPPPWLTHHVDTTAEDMPQTPTAPVELPAQGVSEAGVVDLGTDGLAMVAVASTVNFALRTPLEQQSLIACFGRYLHSLTAPIQVLVRTHRLDLSGQIAHLRNSAASLPHPALERAAREHAEYLTHLARTTDLLRRQVLLVLREDLRAPGRTGAAPDAATSRSGGRRAAEARLLRRIGEATDLLAAAGITVTVLDAGQATAVLAASCNPDSLITPALGLAGANDVITTAPRDEETGHPA